MSLLIHPSAAAWVAASVTRDQGAPSLGIKQPAAAKERESREKLEREIAAKKAAEEAKAKAEAAAAKKAAAMPEMQQPDTDPFGTWFAYYNKDGIFDERRQTYTSGPFKGRTKKAALDVAMREFEALKTNTPGFYEQWQKTASGSRLAAPQPDGPGMRNGIKQLPPSFASIPNAPDLSRPAQYDRDGKLSRSGSSATAADTFMGMVNQSAAGARAAKAATQAFVAEQAADPRAVAMTAQAANDAKLAQSGIIDLGGGVRAMSNKYGTGFATPGDGRKSFTNQSLGGTALKEEFPEEPQTEYFPDIDVTPLKEESDPVNYKAVPGEGANNIKLPVQSVPGSSVLFDDPAKTEQQSTNIKQQPKRTEPKMERYGPYSSGYRSGGREIFNLNINQKPAERERRQTYTSGPFKDMTKKAALDVAMREFEALKTNTPGFYEQWQKTASGSRLAAPQPDGPGMRNGIKQLPPSFASIPNAPDLSRPAQYDRDGKLSRSGASATAADTFMGMVNQSAAGSRAAKAATQAFVAEQAANPRAVAMTAQAANDAKLAQSGITDLGGGVRAMSNKYGTGFATPGDGRKSFTKPGVIMDEKGVVNMQALGQGNLAYDPASQTEIGTASAGALDQRDANRATIQNKINAALALPGAIARRREADVTKNVASLPAMPRPQEEKNPLAAFVSKLPGFLGSALKAVTSR